MTLLQFCKINVISIAQIMLQNSLITGGFFLVAVLIESPLMLLMMLLAVCVANIGAVLFKLNSANLNQGLYGFSAALVGLFVAVFFQFNLASMALTSFGAILAMGLRYRLPLYTLPFIVVSWGLYVLANGLSLPANETNSMWLVDMAWIANGVVSGIVTATGQVMFLSSIPAGMLCLLGLGFGYFKHGHIKSQGKHAMLAIMAAVCAFVLAGAIGVDKESLSMGLWGYNAMLIVLALMDKKPWLWFIGIVTGVAIQWFFDAFLDFTVVGGFLTLPFVLAVWVMLLLNHAVKN